MPSVTEHACLYSNSLFWSKDPAAQAIAGQNVGADAAWRDFAAKLRVCLVTSYGITEPSEHEAD
jgi:hypothetical protein